jgi:hypothetical protein
VPDTKTEYSPADYESAALIFAAAAVAAAEGQYQDAMTTLENCDPSLLVPVAFGLAVLAGQAVIPENGMSGVLGAVQRLVSAKR